MSEAVVTAVGMVSSVGLDAPSSCAAVRAGLSGNSEYADYCPLREGLAHDEPPPLVGALAGFSTRPPSVMPRLFSMCLQEIVTRGGLDRSALGWIPLLSCAPAHAGYDFIERMGLRTGAALTGELVAAQVVGQAGGLAAVKRALEILAGGRHPAVIVIGVDSYFELTVLRALDEAGRLKSARNRDGFIPGECAAGVLIERAAAAASRGVLPLAAIGEPAVASEPRPIGSGEHSTATGLSNAIRAAAAGAPTWTVCDLNGESYRGNEWGNTRARLHRELGGLKHVWHPADCLGDVGAATGPALMAVAATALKRGYAPDERALLWAASDDGARAALVMTSARGEHAGHGRSQ